MKHSTVLVPWEDGLKFRSAARIIKVARSFHSSVVLRCEDRIGDVRSILSMVALCASLGSAIGRSGHWRRLVDGFPLYFCTLVSAKAS